MIKCIDKTDGGGDGAEDWASGYQCLLDEIQWDEEASKIVVHISTSPGHGNSFTGKKEFLNQYIKIPSFSQYNTDDMSKKIFDDIQNKQDAYFKRLISKVAERKIAFFCINGDENSLHCFNQTRSVYNSHLDGMKFIVKNVFGYVFKKDESENFDFKTLERKLLLNIQSGIDVIIPCLLKDTCSEFEQDANEEFAENLRNYESQFYENEKEKIIFCLEDCMKLLNEIRMLYMNVFQIDDDYDDYEYDFIYNE